MIKIKVNAECYTILDVAYVIGAMLSFGVCIAYGEGLNDDIFFLPATFLICFLIFLVRSCKHSLTSKIATFCLFLRYTVLPLFQSMYPVYSFSSYYCSDEVVMDKAVFLMCYELIILSIFIYSYTVLHKNENKIRNTEQDRFPKRNNNYQAIILFCIFAIALGVLNPNVTKQISFFVIKSDTGDRLGNVAGNTLDMIMRQIFVVGVLSLFIVITMYVKKRYYNRKPRLALNVALAGALVCTCMIIAEQRSSQVYCAFASLILLVQVFPQKSDKIKKIIISGAGFVLVMLTIYKTFYAFQYDSYKEAIMQSSRGMEDFVQTLEVYLLGPLSVSSGIEFGKLFNNSSLLQLIFDIGRSTIGLSFFFKSSSLLLTSESYNLYVTAGRSLFGYLLPITGQGYLFLGVLLSPVLICCCIYAAFKLEKKMFTSKSAYVVFFSAYIFIRLATCMVSANLNTVLTSVSIVLISAGMVFAVQWFLNQLMSRGE